MLNVVCEAAYTQTGYARLHLVSSMGEPNRNRKIMDSITLATQIRRADEVVEAEIDGQVVMMSIEQGDYYGLDETGSRIWALLQDAMDVKTLCHKLMAEYEVEESQCLDDVRLFLADMAKHNIVTLQG